MNKNIFREYDIRGVVEVDLVPDVVHTLGKGYGTYFLRHGVTKISLGRDGRLSSPDLRRYLLDGLTETGVDVIDLGVVPTPVVYFSTHTLDVGGGVMITGSHNPSNYNGFKISLGTESIYGSEILSIYDLITDEISVVDPDGHWVDGPNWSPDGNHLAYAQTLGTETNNNDAWILKVVNLETNRISQITDINDGISIMRSHQDILFTADGRYLTYLRFEIGGDQRNHYGIWVVDLETLETYPLEEPVLVCQQLYFPWLRLLYPDDYDDYENEWGWTRPISYE